jgi:hypothetical protein
MVRRQITHSLKWNFNWNFNSEIAQSLPTREASSCTLWCYVAVRTSLYAYPQFKDIFSCLNRLNLSLLMSYIYGAPCKARNFNVYMDLRLAALKVVSFYLLRNVSTLNQCRKLSCGTVVCKHFASYQSYPNYRRDLIWYAEG